MKVIEFDDKADKKRYGPKSLLKDVEKIHQEEGIELMATFYKKKDGSVGIGVTYGNNAEILGLIELGKMMFIEDM